MRGLPMRISKTDQSRKTGVEFCTDPIFVQSCLMQRLGGWTFLETAEGIESPEFCLPLLIGLDKPPLNHPLGKYFLLFLSILSSKSKLGGCSLMKQFSSQNILLSQMKSGSVNVCCIVLLHTCGPAKLDRPV